MGTTLGANAVPQDPGVGADERETIAVWKGRVRAGGSQGSVLAPGAG